MDDKIKGDAPFKIPESTGHSFVQSTPSQSVLSPRFIVQHNQ
ncbi:hypothetical protein GGP99_003333 [Salinibacter ruber]|uniref:Uncharacterized protein n=1 Tax=Salinibacter ruber TaxID=146919 RepID=A0AAW5PDL4_9BACT|nr:hypothetical protein [Salinibacter ruber]MCS4159342.1 hypothetical protein [Salinibacter ruber]